MGCISDEHHVGDVVTVVDSRLSREMIEAKEADDAAPILSGHNSFPNRIGDVEVKSVWATTAFASLALGILNPHGSIGGNTNRYAIYATSPLYFKAPMPIPADSRSP